jgi:NADH-quinone oxidoreductase subunit L
MLLKIIPSLIFLAPLSGLILLTLLSQTALKNNELIIKKVVSTTQTCSFLCTLLVFIQFVFKLELYNFPLEIIHWNIFSFGEHTVNFILKIDKLSIFFVFMATILSNIVGVFSINYLHSDAGFFRFFFLITLFLNGILIIFMGSTFNTIFIGWELIGLTSAMLISFFNARRETIDNALHAFWSYRITDIGILTASAIIASHYPNLLFSSPQNPIVIDKSIAYSVPLLLLLSAMGKSAQYPFSTWLPKAMEGPTSSSAIFYGGLSIHTGVYLLLRLLVEFQVPSLIFIILFIVGTISAIYGSLISQVQSDVKSALAYASISQVGLMLIELSFGLYNLVILHCLGHAFLRTYQILKSASIIHEFLDFEDAHRSDNAKPNTSLFALLLPKKFQNQLFSFAFNLALNDSFGPSKIVIAIEKLSKHLENLETKWLKKFL